jgi:hypothetical protein
MDGRLNARTAFASERRNDMADLRRCIGSERFGIAGHDAPVGDFPAQPSQRDGLGRMCRAHWNQYTAGLARDAMARRAASVGETVAEASVPDSEPATPAEPERAAEPEPIRKRGTRSAAAPVVEGDVG